MNQPDPRIASIPANWAGPGASQKPFELLSAELFNRSYRPARDEYLHVAQLRAPSTLLFVACAAILAFSVWISWTTLADAANPDSDRVANIVVGVGFGLLSVLFLLVVINLIVAAVARRSWANRQCIALGRSGIALRLQGASIDVPWEEVTAIRAIAAGELDRGRVRKIPVLRVACGAGAEHCDLNPRVLGASPVAVYTMLHLYWTQPARRAELGTVQAQRMMDEFTARLSG